MNREDVKLNRWYVTRHDQLVRAVRFHDTNSGLVQVSMAVDSSLQWSWAYSQLDRPATEEEVKVFLLKSIK